MQCKKPELDLITQLSPKFDFPDVADTRERSFKSETLSSNDALIYFSSINRPALMAADYGLNGAKPAAIKSALMNLSV